MSYLGGLDSFPSLPDMAANNWVLRAEGFRRSDSTKLDRSEFVIGDRVTEISIEERASQCDDPSKGNISEVSKQIKTMSENSNL